MAVTAAGSEQSNQVHARRAGSFESLLSALAQEHSRLRARAAHLEEELSALRRGSVGGQSNSQSLESPLESEEPSQSLQLGPSDTSKINSTAGNDSNQSQTRFDRAETHQSSEQPGGWKSEGASNFSAREQPSVPRIPAASVSRRFAVDIDGDDGRGEPRSKSQSSLILAFGARFSGTSGHLQRIVRNPVFELGSGFIIIWSSLLLGMETNYMAENGGNSHPTYSVLNVVLNTMFVGEYVIRLMCEGLQFFCNKDWRWNWTDTILVTCCLADLCIAVVSVNFLVVGRALRLLRLLRLVRTVRLVRTMRAVREFHKMIYAVLSSLRTLVCSLLIWTFVIYFWAILMCQGVIDLRVGTTRQYPQLISMYGSVPSSFFTLFAAASTGIDWADAFDPLEPLHTVYRMAFIVYIALILFGVSNVVTSVFVESAIMSAQHYRDLIVEERLHTKKVAVMHMKEIFKQIDQDNSGEISSAEMEYFLTEPSLWSYVDALGISAEDTRMLFRLLDKDGSGKIDVEEFCDGCLRLQGEAKSMDVHAMIFQVRNFLHKWSEFTAYVEDRFNALDVPPAGSQSLGERRGSKPRRTDSARSSPKVEKARECAWV